MRRTHPTQPGRFIIKAIGWPLLRVRVVGASMDPSVAAGDGLLVLRWASPRVGCVVALTDPREPGRILVKRVRSIGSTGVEVRGDNSSASTDSRTFGPVPAASILGRVVYRYAPTATAGPLR